MLFIIISTLLFGKENASIAVAFFCILLQAQFVGYATLLNFAIICLIMGLSGSIVPKLPALMGLLVNFGLLFTITTMTCDNPQMGNVGIMLLPIYLQRIF